MAQTDHLPIYQRTYDLCLYLEQAVRSFPRSQRYSLGADLRGAARQALRLVVRANSRQDKVEPLLELREVLEEIKALLRLGQDVRAFQSFRSFEHAVLLVVDVAKQNEGWLRHQRRQGPPGGGAGPSDPSDPSDPRDGQNRRVTPSGMTAPSAP